MRELGLFSWESPLRGVVSRRGRTIQETGVGHEQQERARRRGEMGCLSSEAFTRCSARCGYAKMGPTPSEWLAGDAPSVP